MTTASTLAHVPGSLPPEGAHIAASDGPSPQ
jgi:hypothetical protein